MNEYRITIVREWDFKEAFRNFNKNRDSVLARDGWHANTLLLI